MESSSPKHFKVLLIVPPFRSVVRPALSVSLLKAGLQDQEVQRKVLYLNLLFAERIGAPLHEAIGSNQAVSIGDFLFSYLLFNRSEKDLKQYVQDVLVGTAGGRQSLKQLPFKDPVEGLHRLIDQTKSFVDEAIHLAEEYQPSLVGVTSSFQENCAALLFCHSLKKKRPDVVTIMGGANCYGTMGVELIKNFPQLDYVAQGECDLTFPEAVSRIRTGGDIDHIPGMVSRRKKETGQEPRLSSEELEKSPFPDFSDYFNQFHKSSLVDKIQPGMPLETTRGCWWGAKERCLFCGLNNELSFRRKSSQRILDEIDHQVERHHVHSFNVVDNMLDMRHFNDLFPALARRRRLRFFWETPGHLTKSQVASMARAGITHIQPGIESLSDHSLKLMNKPTSRLYNIQTLKWCAEYGIAAYWNHLFGIPGEIDDEADQVIDDISNLYHLRPPPFLHMVRMQRFSKYFEEPEKYGFGRVRPAAVYTHFYPFPPAVVENLVYHFETDWGDAKINSPAYKKLQEAVKKWNRYHLFSFLLSIPLPARMLIIDSRPGQPRRIHMLSGLRRQVIEAIHRVRNKRQIAEQLSMSEDDPTLQNALDDLVRRNLALSGKEGYLALSTSFFEWPWHRLASFRPMPGGHLPHRLKRKMSISLRNRFNRLVNKG